MTDTVEDHARKAVERAKAMTADFLKLDRGDVIGTDVFLRKWGLGPYATDEPTDAGERIR